MNLSERLIEFASKLVKDLTVTEVRLGLGYTSVELSDDSLGLAWTPVGFDPSTTCTHVKTAGTIAGSDALAVLKWLNSENVIERAIGLAVFNAANSKLVKEQKYLEEEVVSLINIQPDEHVVMVGFFGPVIPKIKEIGCKFEIVELKNDKPGVITPDEGKKALAECDVAILTSTSIINGTCDGLMESLNKPREAVLLGPSTPICPQVFKDTPITHLAGSLVLESKKIKQIISEGGGTRLLKKHLKFVSQYCK